MITLQEIKKIKNKKDKLNKNGLFHKNANDFRCNSALRVSLNRRLKYIDLEASILKEMMNEKSSGSSKISKSGSSDVLEKQFEQLFSKNETRDTKVCFQINICTFICYYNQSNGYILINRMKRRLNFKWKKKIKKKRKQIKYLVQDE